MQKISNKRLAKGEILAWNSTIKAKFYELKRTPLRKVSPKTKKKWEEARKICFNNYGHQCFLCGSVDNIEVHHWEETRSRNPARIYDQTNLIPLCKECHKHNGNDENFFNLKEKILNKLKIQ